MRENELTRLPKPSEHGFALLVTLGFLVILTILVVAFFSSVSLDRVAVGSTQTLVEQRLLTESAVAHAASLLAENIPSPNNRPVDPAQNTSFTNWWVNPGRLTTQTDSGSPSHVELYTTPVSGQSAGTVDLNAAAFDDDGNSYHRIEPTGNALDVAWVDVLRDPLRARQSDPAAADHNPVVGRYAFWIDSETNKINFTTALGVASQAAAQALSSTNYDPRGGQFLPVGNNAEGRLSGSNINPWWANVNRHSMGLPTGIGFSGLTDANLIIASKVNWNHLLRLFNVIAEGSSAPFDPAKYHPSLSSRSIKAFVPEASGDAFWDANRFMVTHRSWSPEFNAFGKPRFMHYFIKTGPRDFSKKLVSYQVPLREEALPFIASRSGFSSRIENYPGFPGTLAESMAWARDYYLAYQRALGAYLQYPWPGIGSSFLDKWTVGHSPQDALAEIDQFAWNTTMATANTFDRLEADYVGTGGIQSLNSQGRGYEAVGGDYFRLGFWGGNTSSVTTSQPRGVYSGRGISPAGPLTFLNEVGLQVTPRRQSAANPDVLHLEFCLQTEFFVPPGFGYGSWAMDVPNYRVSYLEYTIERTPFGGGPTNTTNVVARLNQNNTNRTPTEIEAGLVLSPSGNALATHYFVFTNPTVGNDTANVLKAGEVSVVRTPQATGYVEDSYRDPAGNAAVYFAHQPDTTPGTLANLTPLNTGDDIRISNIRLRLVLYTPRTTQSNYFRVIPSRGRPGVATDGLTPATTIEDALIHLPDITMTDIQPGDPSEVESVEIADPRLYGQGTAWQPSSDPGGNSLGTLNAGFVAAPDSSKLAWNNAPGEGAEWYPTPLWYPFASQGYLFTLPTGMQRGIPWSTVNLSETLSSSAGTPPDYLLLDLFAMSTDYGRNHASNGKVNINSTVYPTSFGQNLDRGRRVLASAVQNLRLDGQLLDADGFASWMVNNEPASGYAFSGQFMEAPQLDMGTTTEYGRQLLRSKIVNLFTTQSNTFTVHGLVETVNDDGGPLNVTSRRPFEAIIERQIFQGRDDVAGNASTDQAGNWTKIGNSRGDSFPQGARGKPRPPAPGDPLDVTDGPDSVNVPMPGDSARNETNSSTRLEDSYNPVLPYYHYRILSLKFPD